MSANASGMYSIEAVIGENIPVGAELFWFAFPKNAEPTEDDEIAEFYDDSGADTKTVPENHKVTVSAWLTEGVTYAPVIAVKAEKAEE